MKVVTGSLLLILLAFLGSYWSFARIKLPLAARHFFLTGTEFIIVGFLLGPLAINLIDNNTMNDLQPLLTLALGWTGFLFGLQIHLPLIRKFPPQYWKAGLLQASLVILLLLFPFYYLLETLTGSGQISQLCGAILLAATASCTAQSSLAIFEKELHLTRNRLMEFLRFLSGVDATLAIIITGIMAFFSVRNPIFDVAVPTWIQWFLFVTVLSIVLAFLMDLLIQPNTKQSELMVFIIGFVVFASGIAMYFNTSVLYMTTLMGAIIANCDSAKRIYAVLSILEKPIYIVLLLLAGSMIPMITFEMITLVFAYTLLRFIAKISAGYTTSRYIKYPRNLPPFFGFGLISQGGITVSLALAYRLVEPGMLSTILLFTVLSAIIINEILAAVFMPRLLRVSDQ
ncbi:cation:proton antiporter [bacterium]|nr:cation:proton antiporter [candidate division CSSED10-310 bacterium]